MLVVESVLGEGSLMVDDTGRGIEALRVGTALAS